MGLLGCHVSIAGGMHLAIDRGRELGCEAIQSFTKNQAQWKGKPLDPGDVKEFRRKAKEGPWPAMSHGSYLMNCGTPDDAMYARSVAALKDEVGRCETLGIPYLVFHPGGHMKSGPEAGLKRVGEAISAAQAEFPKGTTTVCVEIMAGAGTLLGRTFEELAAMRDGAADKKRFGVCFDTCHAFAGGHDFTDEAKYEAMWDAFDSTVGLEFLKCFQFNDSMFEFGARKDRHEHIGKGFLGSEPFRLLVNDPRFAKFPMVLETDPEDDECSGWKKDLKTLRGLVGKAEPIKPKKKGQQRIG